MKSVDELNQISKAVLDSSIEVHRLLGPRLLESVYEICLEKELITRGFTVNRQVPLPVIYKNETLELNFRIDLLVDDDVIIEIKAVDTLIPVHQAQLITYLKLSDKRLGLLINFNVPLLKNGFKRMVNNL